MSEMLLPQVSTKLQVMTEAQRRPYILSNGQIAYSSKELTLRDEFVYQHKKNGLIERLYNGVKNLIGIGTGSKKVENAVAKAEAGEISEDDARKTIDKYRKSQVNSAQAFGDLLSVGAAGLTFFGFRNEAKKQLAITKLNEKFGAKKGQFEALIENSKGSWKDKAKKAIIAGIAKVAGQKPNWL